MIIEKIIKTIKNKKGLSLMEILVGSLMFALIAAMVSAVLAPMMLAYSRANDFAEYNTLLDIVGNRIANDMAQSSDIQQLDPLTMVVRGSVITYTVENGILLMSIDNDDPTPTSTPVFPPRFYRGKTIDFSVDVTPPGYTIEVTIGPAQGQAAIGASISREYAVRPLLLIQNG